MAAKCIHVFICSPDQHPADIILGEEFGREFSGILYIPFGNFLCIVRLTGCSSTPALGLGATAPFCPANTFSRYFAFLEYFSQVEVEQTGIDLIDHSLVENVGQRFDMRAFTYAHPIANRHCN